MILVIFLFSDSSSAFYGRNEAAGDDGGAHCFRGEHARWKIERCAGISVLDSARDAFAARSDSGKRRDGVAARVWDFTAVYTLLGWDADQRREGAPYAGGVASVSWSGCWPG